MDWGDALWLVIRMKRPSREGVLYNLLWVLAALAPKQINTTPFSLRPLHSCHTKTHKFFWTYVRTRNLTETGPRRAPAFTLLNCNSQIANYHKVPLREQKKKSLLGWMCTRSVRVFIGCGLWWWWWWRHPHIYIHMTHQFFLFKNQGFGDKNYLTPLLDARCCGTSNGVIGVTNRRGIKKLIFRILIIKPRVGHVHLQGNCSCDGAIYKRRSIPSEFARASVVT